MELCYETIFMNYFLYFKKKGDFILCYYSTPKVKLAFTF